MTASDLEDLVGSDSEDKVAPAEKQEKKSDVVEKDQPSPDAADGVDTSDEGWADLLPEGEKEDIERLLERPYGPFKLKDGTEVVVKPLKLREFLGLLRIITTGSGPMLSQLQLDTGNPTAFAQNMLAALVFAVPEAEREVVEFLVAVTEPTGLPEKAADRTRELAKFAAKMDNPEIEDAINILAVVARSEATDLAALGKRLRAMFKTAQKLGVVPSL